MNLTDKLLNNTLIFFPLMVAIILWVSLGFKSFLLFYGLYSLGMYIHITITTLTNAFIGRDINMKGDVFWKMTFLIIFCLTISLFIFS